VEGTGKVTEVAGTESMLQATEIITHEIIYYSQDENRLQQQFSSMDSYNIILNLVVCILLRVLDQGEGFPSTQLYFNRSFTILFNLQLHVLVVRPSSVGNTYTAEINTADNTSVGNISVIVVVV
jgi:hypothetical protein